MSLHARSSRLLRSALLTSLTLAALAAPAAAAGTTRWVDDDGHAGSASCSGSKTAYTSIQKAINASGAGDTIKVCPGTWTGKLTISGKRDGLSLISVTSHDAVLRAPTGTGNDEISILTIDHVAHVTVKGFALRSRTSGTCRAWTGINAIHAKYVSIRSNDIRPTGSHSDHCGVWSGIVARSGTTGTIFDNIIKDFRKDGIGIRNAGTVVNVRDNDLRFYHLNGPDVYEGQGIDLVNGGSATIISNVVTSPSTAGNTVNDTPSLGAGIQLDHPGAGTDIRFNTMHFIANGIRGFEGSDVRIRDNSFVDGNVGILFQGIDDSEISGNLSTANGFGIYVQSASTGNSIHDNDFRYNSYGDCTDDSSGSKTSGTANTWKNDKGSTDIHPAGLCN